MAVLLDAPELGEEIWVPRSQLHYDSHLSESCEKGDIGEVVVKRWLAEKEGWL